MENKRFKVLLDKYDKGETTAKESEAIEVFFEKMQKGGVDFQYIKNDLGLKNRIYADIFRKIKTSRKKKINRILIGVAASAACIVLYFSIGNIFNQSSSEKQHWIALENFEQNPKQFFLPDSSTIWLSKNSTLEYKKDFGNESRVTKLSGQAFFNITKNPKKPFSIKTGNLTTEVLGTSFNIKENDSLVEVSVSKGLVNISVGSQNLKLTPNQKVSFKTASQTLVKTNTNAQLQQLWFKGEVVLDKVKLADLSEVLEELYGNTFVFKDENAKTVTLYSLRIKRDEPLPKLIQRLNFINEVQLKINKNMIEIRK